MDLEALRLTGIVLVGLVLMALSTRFGMAEYGPQRVDGQDVLIFALGILIVGSYDWLVAPIAIGAIELLGVPLRAINAEFERAGVVVQFICFAVLSDFLSYWSHRWLHGRSLWRFHAFHHSAKSLTFLSGMRGSPLHFIFVLTPGTLVGALFLASHSPWMVVALVLFEVVTQNLIHTNIRLPAERTLEKILVTPRMHFVHHHPDPRYNNANYGFFLSIWDRMFGTYVDADAVTSKGRLGIDYQASSIDLFLGREPRRQR